MEYQTASIAIPDGVRFSDLRLARDPDGDVSVDFSVIEKICQASDFPFEPLRDGPEDNLASLIVNWYQAHLAQGGARDPVADDLIAEVEAEDRAGQAASHPPGRA